MIRAPSSWLKNPKGLRGGETPEGRSKDGRHV